MRYFIVALLVYSTFSWAKEPLASDVVVPSKKFAVELAEASEGKPVIGIACKDTKAPSVSCMLIAEHWLTPNHDSPSLGREFYLRKSSAALAMYESLRLPIQQTDIPDTREVVSLKFLDVLDPYMGEIGLICAIVVNAQGELTQSLCTLFTETSFQEASKKAPILSREF